MAVGVAEVAAGVVDMAIVELGITAVLVATSCTRMRVLVMVEVRVDVVTAASAATSWLAARQTREVAMAENFIVMVDDW